MHLSQKLMIHGLLALTMSWATQPVSFRGQSAAEIQSQALPLSFAHLVESIYGLSPQNLHVERGSYLIIAADVYAPYLSPFVEFKRSQGFDAQLYSLAEIGYTAPEIKAFIQAQLDANPLLEYVLLVGDVDGVGEVPSFYYGAENDVSDQTFSHLRGDDLIPDIFVGRFSVDSISELAVVISKTIYYHRDPLSANNEWLNRALVVAGNYSNTLPIPVTPKWTSYWVKEELELNGYSSVDTVFYPPVQQGGPLIRAAIDQGVGLVNYRGWGDANGWHYPEFHVGDVASLNNGWMTPVFTSFVCNANDFANSVDPCLGESIIRSGTPSAPKGGVAIIGPSDLHTSTKYNNIINAYMYDAMLDEGVVELAPAMLAGQLGMLTEFPHEDGPGEAQEKYFNVYNVLGDPSLNVYIGTPDEFTVTVSPVSANDGFVEVYLENSNQQPVHGAIVALLSGGELLAKGQSDVNGKAYFSIDTLVSTLDVYANHPRFIQGHLTLTVNPQDQNIILSGYSLNATGGKTANPGDIIAVTPELSNVSGATVPAGSGEVTTLWNGQLITSVFQYPELPSGASLPISTPIELRVAGYPFQGPVRLTLASASGDWSGMVTIPVNPPALNIQPDFILSESVTDPVFRIQNTGSCKLTDVTMNIQSLADSLTIEFQGNPTVFSIDPFSEQWITLQGVTIIPGQVAPGSDLSYEINLVRDTLTVYHHSDNFSIPAESESDPVAHNTYGYWVYDDLDAAYIQRPEFNWIELDPNYGGSGGEYHPLDDDDHVDFELPFTFQYFGQTYSTITISSNGWISFIPCDINYFWNYTIPMALGPRAQVAVFWDDLEVVGTDSIRVFTRYDEAEGRLVIEWSRALNNFDEVTAETFELILYTQSAQPTATGDNVLDIQYLDIGNVDVVKNYATVGIEGPDQNDGIQVTFNNTYAPGAAPLENSRVYRFTTEAPEGYIQSLSNSKDLPVIANRFQIHAAYPNPFNPVTTIPVTISEPATIHARIYDLTGRLVYDFGQREYNPGTIQLRWSGIAQSGKPVASGTYFLLVSQKQETQTKKLILLK